jgi:hypothetical protein
MSKNGDIKIAGDERHKVPNSEVRGYINQLKKDEKKNYSRSLELLNAQISTSSDVFVSMLFSSVVGLIATHFYPQFNSGGYWIALFLSTGFLNSLKLNYKKVIRDDYTPSWKKEK